MDEQVRAYIDAIPPPHRPLFDRLHELVLSTCPEAELVFAYAMPTYRIGKRRLFIAAWKHGISLYGWGQGHDGGFLDRYPQLRASTGTLRLRPEDAAAIPDAAFRDLFRAVLSA